jgi:hypothetical protein
MTKAMSRLESVIQAHGNSAARIWEEARRVFEEAERMPDRRAVREYYHFHHALVEHCHALNAIRVDEPELAKGHIEARDAELKAADAWAAGELWTRTATAHLTTDALWTLTHAALTERRWAEARVLLDDLGLRHDIHDLLASAEAYGLRGPYLPIIQDRIDLVNSKVG